MGLTLLIAGLTTGTATAVGTRAVAECSVDVGSVTATGGHVAQLVKASVPISVTTHRTTTGVYYPGRNPGLSSYFSYDLPATEGFAEGYSVVQGVLYRSRYAVVPQQQNAVSPIHDRVGGGWGVFTTMEHVRLWTGTDPERHGFYGLRNDGTLFRWSIDQTTNTWRATGSFAGLPSMKTFTVIAKNTSFDTLLANTSGGELYTIRIPLSSPMQPTVTRVRTATWQNLDTLIARGCGDGTLLVGVDKDTKSAYLYSMGHADGPQTSIVGRGKIPGTFGAATLFRWAWPASNDPLEGDG